MNPNDLILKILSSKFVTDNDLKILSQYFMSDWNGDPKDFDFKYYQLDPVPPGPKHVVMDKNFKYLINAGIEKKLCLCVDNIVRFLATVPGHMNDERKKYYWIFETKLPKRFIYVESSFLNTIVDDDFRYVMSTKTPWDLFDEIPDEEEGTGRNISFILSEQVKKNFK